MDKFYLLLLTISALLLLADAVVTHYRRDERRHGVKLLPLGLFFWVLVPWFQFADKIF